MVETPIAGSAQSRSGAGRGYESLSENRAGPSEEARVRSLIDLVPGRGRLLLDAGARDGFVAERFTTLFDAVVALDLDRVPIHHPAVFPVQGDITHLGFRDGAFDTVLCAEVLEHISPAALAKACKELSRVARRYVVIGVPYRQDLRVGRTKCYTCGERNPPWGHVNTFDEEFLLRLFPDARCVKLAYEGNDHPGTNSVSSFLMDLAGNPYGTYSQDERCVHCGSTLHPPRERRLHEKVLTKLAFWADQVRLPGLAPKARWMHVLFEKTSSE